MGAHGDVSGVLGRLCRGILGDDSGARAGSVQEDAVEALHHGRDLATVVGADHGVCDAQPEVTHKKN